jgi:PAS domain S-box-containing protein
MDDKHKTNEQLAEEIAELRRDIGGLRESERKYRTLFEESKDVLYVCTPDGNFLDINAAGVELFGYDSKEDMMAINIARDLFVNFQEKNACVDMVRGNGFVKDYEAVMKRKDGAHVVVLVTALGDRDESGKVVAYRGIIKDITEWKRLEQQLFQAQKMEAIGQLAGGIAHDFNNILTAIIGYGNLLKTHLKDGPPSKYLNYILESADRAAKLIQDLLAFSRRQMISPRLVDLNTVIEGIKNILSRLIGEDIELSVNLCDGTLPVIADSTQIEQVLLNLATNARDAMAEGGSLFISTEVTTIDERFIKTYGYGKTGEYALITVSDTGSGMDQKTKEKIFEPFFSTKEVGKGTGLGLSMVYGIVKQHNGYINVYSETGRGSTFRIYLPSMREESLKEIEPDAAALEGGTETILLAEDDFPVKKYIRELLEGVGYTVIEAGDGKEVLEVFSKYKDTIRMIILDLIMPKMNGKEVFGAIRELNPRVKALFISGYSADILHQKKIVEDGYDVISKPVSSVKLLTKVREVLQK